MQMSECTFAKQKCCAYSHLVPYTGVNVRVTQQTLFVCYVKVSAVCDACQRRRVSGWSPGIDVGIKVNDRDWTIHSIQRTKNRKN